MNYLRNTFYGLVLSAVCGVAYGQQPNSIKTFIDCANTQLGFIWGADGSSNIAYTTRCFSKIGGQQEPPENFQGCYLTLTSSPSKQPGCSLTAKDGTEIYLPRVILNCPGPPPDTTNETTKKDTTNLRFWPTYTLCPNPAWNNKLELGEDQINANFAVPFTQSSGQMIMAEQSITPVASGGKGPYKKIDQDLAVSFVTADKKGTKGCNACHASAPPYGAEKTLQFSKPGNPFGVFDRAGGDMVPLIVFTNDPNQGINKDKKSPIPVKQDLKTVCSNIAKYKAEIVAGAPAAIRKAGGGLGITVTEADVSTSAAICNNLLALTAGQ